MHVAHFKTCTFACQTTWAQCRHTAFVRDFRQRIGLVHKLRQLAGTEKFLNRCGNGFGVNQVGRHQSFAFRLIQTLFHGTFHARQTCTELVFHQFTHGTHATVTQMVNIIHFAMAVAQLYQRGNRHHDVFHAQNMQFGFFFAHAGKSFIQQAAIPVIFLCRQQFLLISARVEFHAANARQIVALLLEEHTVEQGFYCFIGRRFARTHHTVDGDTCSLLVACFISTQRCRQIIARIGIIDKQGFDFFHTLNIQFCQQFFRNFAIGSSKYFTGIRNDNIVGQSFAQQNFRINR